jgi:putative endonuclease
MKPSRQALGKWGEEKAAAYLKQKGYEILDRNSRTPYGEIDLVAQQSIIEPTGDQVVSLVFVEVKTRSNLRFGYPEESVTPKKRAHLLASAQAYLQARPDLTLDWRVDVIAIQRLDGSEDPLITHFENALV